MVMTKVVVFMGSDKDYDFAKPIKEVLSKFGIETEYRIASAHKTAAYLLDAINQYDDAVFIGIAGRSNALCGMLDASTALPVITCPPVKSFPDDIWSSLRMPSGVSPMVIMDPKNAALAAAKIIGLKDESVRTKVAEYKKSLADAVMNADKALK